MVEENPAAGPAPAQPAEPHRARLAFRRWRGTRPFWGGLFVTLAGAEIMFTVWAPLRVVLHIGMEGLAGYLIPAIMVLCGLLLLFSPAQRLFYSVLSALCALGSWVTSNLGGFIIGLLLGLIGSALAFGWVPDQEPRHWRRQPATADGPAEGFGHQDGEPEPERFIKDGPLTGPDGDTA